MDTQIHRTAVLAFVDQRLDDLREDFGDLPLKIKSAETKVNDLKAMYDETRGILKDIRTFCSTSKITLVELKEKEEKLAKQQFLVRNNKEFDAITTEIENIRKEHENLSDKLRTEGVKVENLVRILDEQKENYEKSKEDFETINEEIEILSSDQNEELNELTRIREKVEKQIDKKIIKEYNRVRTYHGDAAVNVKRNSCKGCFSAVPPQTIVEVRNNLNKIYFCENCGRILVPEDIFVDDSTIDNL